MSTRDGRVEAGDTTGAPRRTDRSASENRPVGVQEWQAPLKVLKNNWLGWGIIFFTWLIFFWRIIFGGQVYFLDDLKILYYPIEHAYAQFQANWQLPVWSPDFGFGQPLLAWGQLGFFTPLHLLLRIFQLHPIVLLNISIAAYVAAGLLGMYSFLHYQKLSSLASALGAIVFGLCGFTIGHLNHVNFTTATMLLPWLLLVIARFLEKPTVPAAALLALIAAAIPLSGQPQVSLYTFIIAAVFGLITVILKGKRLVTRYVFRVISLTVVAGFLAFSLASFSILPLREFLPFTDRSGDLPTSELYEFSYPPAHAVTLLFPYYFGDHELYRGAKNFQELAAYVGVVPLLLAFLALFTWRRYVALRATGLLLIIISLAFAPGIYSPIYRFLIENHILGSLAVPGRFVYFFDVGVALLAALGLEDIYKLLSKRGRGWHNGVRPEDEKQRLPLKQLKNEGEVLFEPQGREASAVTGPAVIALLLVALTAANLIWWGWDYNPLVSRTSALSPSPFTQNLKQYEEMHGVPARLLSTETLPLSGNPSVSAEPTEPIGPLFTVHQQLRLRENVPCLIFPFTLTTEALHSEVSLSLRDEPATPPFFSTSIASDAIAAHPLQRFCVPELQTRSGRDIIMTLASDKDTNIQAFQRLPIGDEYSALYVRVPEPTLSQLQRSKKVAHLVVTQDKSARADLEKDLLIRHIQATANSSAARWAGALGIGNFRTFIDAFFANDHDPIDGEGVHALVRNRNFVNMSGITHLAQAVPEHEVETDSVLAAGYRLVKETVLGTTHLRLYENPEAFPKAFLIGTAIWEPGPDQTRHALGRPEYDGRRLIFVSGPTPPETGALANTENLNLSSFSSSLFENGRAEITRYEPTQVDVKIEAPQPAWLVLTDSTTPAWHTFIDGAEAPPYIANTVFRAAYVPAGSHTVSFRYISPAIRQAKWLTITGLLATSACLLPWLLGRWQRRTAVSPPNDPC